MSTNEGRLTRREFIQGMGAAGVALCLPFSMGTAHGADFPSREIFHIIAFKPGGSSDRSSRPLEPFLRKHFGVPVVMQNVPGASGMVGWTQFMKEKPDGYTMCYVNWPLVYQAVKFKNARFKISDFAHIGGMTDDPMLFVRHKDSKHKWENFGDFVEDCKKNPNTYKLSMTGPASPHNIACHVVMKKFGIKFNVINAPGGSGEAAAMLAGQHVDGMVGPALSSYGLRDTAVCFGILSDRKVPNMWPEGELISKTMNVKIQPVTIPRGFATHAKVKEKYPERFKFLVEKFKAAMLDPEYIAMVEKAGSSDVVYYFPPEELDAKAQNLMELVDEYSHLFE